MKRAQAQEIRPDVQETGNANVQHAFDVHQKLAFHRGQVLEGVRLRATRNRGFWHEFRAELVREWEVGGPGGTVAPAENCESPQ